MQVAFPSLESIRVKRLDCLKSIWHGQPIADSFCKLELVEVWYCDSLLKVFPSNYMLRRFHNLRRFYIRPWKILDEVFLWYFIHNLKIIMCNNPLNSLHLRGLDRRVCNAPKSSNEYAVRVQRSIIFKC